MKNPYRQNKKLFFGAMRNARIKKVITIAKTKYDQGELLTDEERTIDVSIINGHTQERNHEGSKK